MAKEIEFIIDADGTVHAEAKGFKGSACSTLLDKLMRALGGRFVERKKPEYFQQETERLKAGRR